MPNVDMKDFESHKDLPSDLRIAVEDKLMARAEFAKRVSITRLDYIFRVMRQVWHGKHTISNPDSFTDKIKRVERKDRLAAIEAGLLNRANSASSFGSSMYSKSAKTGLSARSGSSAGTENLLDQDGEEEEGTSFGINSDPVVAGIKTVFEECQNQIKDDGDARIQYIKRTLKHYDWNYWKFKRVI